MFMNFRCVLLLNHLLLGFQWGSNHVHSCPSMNVHLPCVIGTKHVVTGCHWRAVSHLDISGQHLCGRPYHFLLLQAESGPDLPMVHVKQPAQSHHCNDATVRSVHMITNPEINWSWSNYDQPPDWVAPYGTIWKLDLLVICTWALVRIHPPVVAYSVGEMVIHHQIHSTLLTIFWDKPA